MPPRKPSKPSAPTVTRRINAAAAAFLTAASGHGGARPGAGRKKSKLDPELLAELGKPPLGKPLELSRWYTDGIAALLFAVAQGRCSRELLEVFMRASNASARVLPLDIIYEAGKRLDRDEKDMKDAGAVDGVVERKDDSVAQRARPVRRDPA